MRIFDVEPKIEDLDGFKPEIDIFKRSRLGEGLTHLVTTVEQPLVIAVDADWGSGKTVFLKMWAGELRKRGVPVIYFDAFANDYYDDAFLAIAGELVQLAQQSEDSSSPTLRKFTRRAVGVGKILLRSAGRIGVKAATLGALDGSDVEKLGKELTSDLASEASKLSDNYLEQLLAGGSERKATFAGFKEMLSELPIQMAPKDGSTSGYRPLVLIIDELDRCRPPFALQLLERIKHFFSVPNVHFVLGVHLDQLANSVRGEYGSGIDARSYLDKFIHLTVPLVDVSDSDREPLAAKYIRHLSVGLARPGQERQLELLGEFVLRYHNRNGLTFRHLQRLYIIVALAFAVANDELPAIPPLIAGLAIMKLKHPDLYRKAKRGVLTYSEVERLFGFDELPAEVRGRRDIEWALGFWRSALDPTAPDDLRRKLGGVWRWSSELVVPMLANELIDRFKPRD